MIDKILKDTYVNPKVELTQKEYNDLVAMARMKAKKIEERAREIYEKEGVTKIDVTARFYRKTYGEVESDKYNFYIDVDPYMISPRGDIEHNLYIIPQKSRERIAKFAKDYLSDVYEAYFGSHLNNLNEIMRLKHELESKIKRFHILMHIAGWLMAFAAIALFFGH